MHSACVSCPLPTFTEFSGTRPCAYSKTQSKEKREATPVTVGVERARVKLLWDTGKDSEPVIGLGNGSQRNWSLG